MTHPVGTITTQELWDKILRSDPFYLVEILPPSFFRHTHLPGAVNLPPRDVQTAATTLLPDQNAEIVVYCIGFT